MPSASLETLLERNRRHEEELPEGHFEGVRAGQEPAAVAVCCSDSRVSQEGMWSVEEPGWLFTPSTIGNLVWDRQDGERIVDGSVLYPIRHTETRTTVVVGHTGCGAITAAYHAVRGEGSDEPPGIANRIDLLVPVVERALADGVVGPETPESEAVNRLVEYHVREAVAFLRDAPEVPKEESIYGFVYDFQEVYGEVAGRAYLVSASGETDEEALRGLVPEGFEGWVGSLL
jgi:carbonic anhydrase